MSKRRGKRRGLANELDELLRESKRAKNEIQTESVALEIENEVAGSVDDDSSHRATPKQTTSSREKTPAMSMINYCKRKKELDAELLNVLGIGGYIALIQAIQHVPGGFFGYRYQYMANMLAIATKTDIQASNVKHYIDMLPESSTDIAAGKLPLNLLWKATFKYNFPHTLFLAPPVVTCLRCAGTLQTHHSPSVIICYTLDGPLPAAKITLRCRQCGLNYRYILL